MNETNTLWTIAAVTVVVGLFGYIYVETVYRNAEQSSEIAKKAGKATKGKNRGVRMRGYLADQFREGPRLLP